MDHRTCQRGCPKLLRIRRMRKNFSPFFDSKNAFQLWNETDRIGTIVVLRTVRRITGDFRFHNRRGRCLCDRRSDYFTFSSRLAPRSSRGRRRRKRNARRTRAQHTIIDDNANNSNTPPQNNSDDEQLDTNTIKKMEKSVSLISWPSSPPLKLPWGLTKFGGLQ